MGRSSWLGPAVVGLAIARGSARGPTAPEQLPAIEESHVFEKRTWSRLDYRPHAYQACRPGTLLTAENQ